MISRHDPCLPPQFPQVSVHLSTQYLNLLSDTISYHAWETPQLINQSILRQKCHYFLTLRCVGFGKRPQIVSSTILVNEDLFSQRGDVFECGNLLKYSWVRGTCYTLL